MTSAAERLTYAAELYEDGLSVGDIAKTLGLSREGARQLLMKAGVKLRPPSGGRPEGGGLSSADVKPGNCPKHLKLIAKSSAGKGFPYCVRRPA